MDELKKNSRESPYISPNKVLSEDHKSDYYVPYENKMDTNNLEVKHSPYLLNGATGFSGNYMSVPHNNQQVHHINYKGVYGQVARKVKDDK